MRKRSSLRAEVDRVLRARDPALRAVLGAVPVLFARLRLDDGGVRVLDLDADAAEREALERARLFELATRPA